jgi:hypothetical protein
LLITTSSHRLFSILWFGSKVKAMMKIRAILILLVVMFAPAIVVAPTTAVAQSGCAAIAPGAVLTAGQWNACFSFKQDALGYVPCNLSGCTLTGPLITAPSTTLNAGFNVPPGTAPTSPNAGDIWATSTTGLSYQVNGISVNYLGLVPVQTVTGASKTYGGLDLFQRTRRSNSASAMTDTLPASTALTVDGERLQIANVDASASDTISAGAATTILGGSTFVLTAGRDLMLVYDLANTAWRGEGNTPTALLGPNNLFDLSNTTTAMTNLFPTATRAGDVLYWNGTSWTHLSGNNSGTLFLQETAAGVPSWGTLSGSGTVVSGTANDLAYYATSTNAVSPLATANNGVLVTSSGGVPSISTTIPAATQNNITNLGTIGSVGAPIGTAFGGTGVTSPTAHSVPFNEGASAQNNSGAGAIGAALVAQGASADPIFVQGARVLLATLTATNSTNLSDTTHFTSAYSNYEIVYDQVVSGTGSSTCILQIYTGSAVLETSGYIASYVGIGSGSARAGTETTYIPCGWPASVTTSTTGISGTIRLYNAPNTVAPKMMVGDVGHYDGADWVLMQVGGAWTTSNVAITGILSCFSTSAPTCLTTTAGIVSGTISIYGIN